MHVTQNSFFILHVTTYVKQIIGIAVLLLMAACQPKKVMTNINCDPETGLCMPAQLSDDKTLDTTQYTNMEIIYVGDPMCSWCWGISPALKEVREYYAPKGINYKIVVGGLRPGGGDAWTPEFKEFLKHHWEEVNERSGQPFGYTLFEKDTFEYDTEPACRAVVAARPQLEEKEMEFFEAVQHKFYVDNEDPKEVSFYESICKDMSLDFTVFKQRFQDPEVKKATYQEFMLNREWGVKGYPSVFFRKDNELFPITHGYTTTEQMKKQIERLLE